MFSIVIPLDDHRLNQFKNTKLAYDGMPQKKEFIIPTRHEQEIRRYLNENNLSRDVKIIPYAIKAGFNCSKALNIGVRNSTHDSVIITSPEVKPITPVLDQLEKLLGNNVVCQVWDEDEWGSITISLVNTRHRHRNKTPGFYFLAMFNKSDIVKINGWDEEFMKGCAYEDKDFGLRWVRAGIPFMIRDDIQARHQYHPRKETTPGGYALNRRLLEKNNAEKITKCVNGLVKL